MLTRRLFLGSTLATLCAWPARAQMAAAPEFRVIEARAERLKRSAAEQMTAMGKRKLETPRCVLALRPSKAVEVLDEAKIPDAYFAIKRTVQKAEIAKALKAGAEVPGAVMVERENLTVK